MSIVQPPAHPTGDPQGFFRADLEVCMDPECNLPYQRPHDDIEPKGIWGILATAVKVMILISFFADILN